MSKQEPTFEWQAVERDADWEELCAAYPTSPTPSQECSARQRLWGAVAMLLMLSGVSQWWWHTAQREPTAATEQELRALVQPEASPPLSGQEHFIPPEDSLRVTIQTVELAAHPDITIDAIEIHGDRALATVMIGVGNGEAAQRQTRFYLRTATGWVQTAPSAALWGAERSLETPYFVYHFRQNDGPAVIAVAPQIDSLYTTLSRNFGLPIIPTLEKLDIDVSVTNRPGQASLWFDVPERITVPSPAVYLAPVALTDVELLAQSIALLLLDAVIAQVGEQYALGSTWQPMLRGVRLWQVWDLDLPLAAWREEVVRWLYVDLPTASSGQSDLLPNHYPKLCADHKLWMPSPLQIDIPFVCAERESEYIDLLPWSGRGPPMRLEQLAVPVLLDEELIQSSAAGQVIYSGRVVVLATLIEYAVATYGHERLSTLMAGMGHYDTWDTLIPAVYGVSAAEFEVGWQTYMVSHYRK